MPIFDNDRPLLMAFRAGERAALDRVYRHYVDDVLAVVRRGFAVEWKGQLYVPGSNREASEDLVQEVFVRAFSESARLSFDGLRPYRPYLLTIARNLLADSLRRKRPDIELTPELEDSITTIPPDEDPSFERDLSTTREFIAKLDGEMQAFVRLRYVEGRSQAEVAAALGRTRRRVRTLEKAVTVALRRHLKKRDFPAH